MAAFNYCYPWVFEPCLFYPVNACATDKRIEDGRKTLPAFFSYWRNVFSFYHFWSLPLALPYVGMLIGNMLFSFVCRTWRLATDHLHACIAPLASGGMWLLFTMYLKSFCPAAL